MTLEIKKYPDPVLRRKAEEIKEVNDEIRKLAQDMIDTMIANDGVGLAANQVGILKRIIVVQTEEGPQIFINPEIIERSRQVNVDQEGCLSLPNGLYLGIKRVREIRIRALNFNGERIQMKLRDFTARIFQHEVDHINGILIIDRIGFWQKIKIKKQLQNSN